MSFVIYLNIHRYSQQLLAITGIMKMNHMLLQKLNANHIAGRERNRENTIFQKKHA